LHRYFLNSFSQEQALIWKYYGSTNFFLFPGTRNGKSIPTVYRKLRSVPIVYSGNAFTVSHPCLFPFKNSCDTKLVQYGNTKKNEGSRHWTDRQTDGQTDELRTIAYSRKYAKKRKRERKKITNCHQLQEIFWK
jgi:hypothetical protein